MVAREMAHETNSYQRQKSKKSHKDRKNHIRYWSSKHTKDGITSGQVGGDGAVETNALFIGKVEDKEGNAVEQQQQSC